VLIVAGLSLKNLKPRVWDKTSPHYLPGIEAVMVSYADFHKMAVQRQAAMTVGLHEYLGVSKDIKIYLDNGAFYFLTHDGETPKEAYEEFVDKAKPDWWPIVNSSEEVSMNYSDGATQRPDRVPAILRVQAPLSPLCGGPETCCLPR